MQVKYAAQSLLCSSLQRKQKSPPSGSQVIAQVLGHRKVKYPEQGSISGRLLHWDHLQDQLSYLLCPSEEGDESQEPTVQRAALPVLAPPETPEPKATFGTPLKDKDPGHPVDLDMDDMVVSEEKPEKEEEIDEPIELDELEGTPFTYFYLSSDDSPQVMNAEEEDADDDDDDDVILMEEASPPINSAKDLEEEAGKKHATTHISVSPDVVLASTGEERQKWLAAGKKEIDNLTILKDIQLCHLRRKQLSRRRLNSRGRIILSCQRRLSLPSNQRNTRSAL